MCYHGRALNKKFLNYISFYLVTKSQFFRAAFPHFRLRGPTMSKSRNYPTDTLVPGHMRNAQGFIAVPLHIAAHWKQLTGSSVEGWLNKVNQQSKGNTYLYARPCYQGFA